MLPLFIIVDHIRTRFHFVDIISMGDPVAILFLFICPVINSFDMRDVFEVILVHRDRLFDMFDTLYLHSFLRCRFSEHLLQNLPRCAFGNGIDASDAAGERFVSSQAAADIFVDLLVG